MFNFKSIFTYCFILTAFSSCIKLKKSGESATVNTTTTTDNRPATIEFSENQNLSIEKLNELGAQTKKISGQDTYIIQAKQIILKDQVELKVNDLNLQIITDKLTIEGQASIVTFKSDNKAELNQNGREGGRIYVQALSADGQLNFILNGENGGDGLSGEAPDSAINGYSGSAGDDGALDANLVFNPNGFQVYQTQCTKIPSLGHLGGPGLKGYSGHKGKDGGATAELILKIQDKKNFTYLIQEQNPGIGGLAGIGGAGGSPGVRGPSGKVYVTQEGKRAIGSTYPENLYYKLCEFREYSEVYPAAGPQGDPGTPGDPGLLKKNIIE